MASSSYSTHFLILFLISLATSSSAFNVTNVLGPLPEFSTFTNYLAQAGLVGMMTDLNNVTILAVDNANMAPISGKSFAEMKRIMTMHVIPEYYDLHRLNSLPNGAALIRTAYVMTGLARGKEGMLLVNKRGKMGRFSFASAQLPRARPDDVNLVKSVVVLSRNISVFHVSGLIVTPPPVAISEISGGGAAGVAAASKLMVRRSFVPKTKVKGGMKLQLEDDEPSTDYDLETVEKAETKEEAPAKSPSKSKSASPKKAPAKAPSKSSSGGKKAKSPSPAPSSDSDDDSSAPPPSKKKSSSPSPAPSKDAPSPKKSKSSAPSPSGSSEDTSAPSKSDSTSSSPSSDAPPSGTSSSPTGESTSQSSPPAPSDSSSDSSSSSDSADADSPASDAPAADAPSPSGGAVHTVSSSVGILMAVTALWALVA
ncbi:Fasciclin-like arabinogalactan protein 14 [Linum perenne]